GVRQPEKDEAGRRSPVVADIAFPIFCSRALQNRPHAVCYGELMHPHGNPTSGSPPPSQCSVANGYVQDCRINFLPLWHRSGRRVIFLLLALRISRPKATPNPL